MAAQEGDSFTVMVRFTGVAANVAGKNEHQISVRKGATVNDLADDLEKIFGQDFGEIVRFKQGTPRALVTIYINEQDIKQLGGMEAPIPVGSNISMAFRAVPWVGG